jgi:hypothetical protein
MTREQRNDLARLVNDYLGHALSETPLAMVDAWDAAPADPAGAVMTALLDTQGSARPGDVDHVLAALGMPGGST